MTAQQINQLKEQRTALFDLSDARAQASEAEKAEAQSQIEQAKANYEAQQQAEEARKQAAEEAKQAEENAAKEAEARTQRLNDFRVNAEENILSQVAALRETADKNDFAALDAKTNRNMRVK